MRFLSIMSFCLFSAVFVAWWSLICVHSSTDIAIDAVTAWLFYFLGAMTDSFDLGNKS